MDAHQIAAALRPHRFRFVTEDDLQSGVAIALEKAGIKFEREARIGPRDRIDFMVGDVGIEVKIKGGTGDLTRQLFRYARNLRVRALILVTSENRLAAAMPARILDVPIEVVTYSRAFA